MGRNTFPVEVGAMSATVVTNSIVFCGDGPWPGPGVDMRSRRE